MLTREPSCPCVMYYHGILTCQPVPLYGHGVSQALTTISNNIMFNMPRAAINFNDGSGNLFAVPIRAVPYLAPFLL